MIVNKSFKYRIYPNKDTEIRLLSWLDTLRCLWNIAHEQRMNGLQRTAGTKIFPSCFDQQRELKYLRKSFSFFKDAPQHAECHLLSKLDLSWQRFFNKIANIPHWKSRKTPIVSITEFDPCVFSLCKGKLKFPKLPLIKTVVHRPLEGKSKTCSIVKEGAQWFAVITCEIDINPVSRTEPKVAIDRGIKNFIGTSDRTLVPNPLFLESASNAIRRIQRTMNRRKVGSNNFNKAKSKLRKLHKLITNRRNNFLHLHSHHISKSHGIVVVEDLQINNMVKNPNLSRYISQSGWGKLVELLKYKLEWSGGSLIKVPAFYSSQECSSCGHIDKLSRKGITFCCTKCGYNDHADLNAPKVLLNRASCSVQPVEGSCADTPQGNRKVKLRVSRRKQATAALSHTMPN